MANTENEIKIPEEIESAVHFDLGTHYKRTKLYEKANENFEKSYHYEPNARALVESCKCKMETNQYPEALKYAKECIIQFPNRIDGRHVQNDCLYHLSHFEEALKHSRNIIRQRHNDYLGTTLADAIELHVKAATGTLAGKRLRHLAIHMNDDLLDRRAESTVDEMDESKTLKDGKECDVTSECEVAEFQLPERLKKHMLLQKANMHKQYFNTKIADQIDFWHSLIEQKPHQLVHLPSSSKRLSNIVENSLADFHLFEEALWSRNPLYAKRVPDRTPDKTLFYSQDTTRRKAFIQLIKLKKLARANIPEMVNFINDILITFYNVTSETIFPRKFEFTNEICNIAGMTFLKHLVDIPNYVMTLPLNERAISLLKLSVKKQIDSKKKKVKLFGARDSAEILEARKKDAFNRKFGAFQDHLRQTSYDIDKCYVFYQLSELHLKARKIEEAQQYAEEAFELAKMCKNTLWQFLSYLNCIRCHAMKENYVRIKGMLEYLFDISHQLNEFVVKFVELLMFIVEELNNKSK